MDTIIRFFRRPYRWAAVFGTALTLFFAFALLDAFVIPKTLMYVPDADRFSNEADNPSGVQEDAGAQPEAHTDAAAHSSDPVITDTSYEDENIKIAIETAREYDTTFYVAEIWLSDASLLRTALAKDTYGRNIKQTTSAIADAKGAILAVNGDYYGFRDYGYVLRNGVLYRDTSSGEDALVIDENGDFSIAGEDTLDADALEGVWQVLSFGPALVEHGEIAVSEGSEVSGKSMNSNPRTAIGQVGPLHYIMIVSDGRTGNNAGLSLYQLAQEFRERGCTVAYNLDGGGSSCMVFNGSVVNTPVDGRRSGERQVSDIVYIGYE